MAKSRSVTGSNIGLSFIDVLASAMGAAVLLFVIFASTPPQTPSKVHAVGTFLRYEWHVKGTAGALMVVKIYHGDQGVAPIWTSPQLATIEPAVVYCPVPGIQSILFAGFSADSGVAPDGNGGVRADVDRTYVLRINDPNRGKWRANIVYFDWAGDQVLSGPPTVHVTESPVAADSSVQTNADEPKFDLAFGQEQPSAATLLEPQPPPKLRACP